MFETKYECPKCSKSFKAKKPEFCPHCGARLEGGTAEIVMVLDRSGSMASCVEATISGFNQFIEQQRTMPGKARVTLVQFDTEYEVVFDHVDLSDVPQLDTTRFVPRGGTALYDAVGRTINQVVGTVPAGSRVVFVILTDGGENSSREYKADTIKGMIQAREGAGWVFVYIGANQDAMLAASEIGVSLAANYTATPDGTSRAYERINMVSFSARSGMSTAGIMASPDWTSSCDDATNARW